MRQNNQLDEAVSSIAARILMDKSARSKRTLLREFAAKVVVREEKTLRQLKALIKLEMRLDARNEPPD